MLSDLEIYEINRLTLRNQTQSTPLEYWTNTLKNGNKILSRFTPQQLLDAINDRKNKGMNSKMPSIEVEVDFRAISSNSVNLPKSEGQSNTRHDLVSQYVIEANKNDRKIKHVVKDSTFYDIEQSCTKLLTETLLTEEQLFEALKNCNSDISMQSKRWSGDDDNKLQDLLNNYSWDDLKQRADFLEMKYI